MKYGEWVPFPPKFIPALEDFFYPRHEESYFTRFSIKKSLKRGSDLDTIAGNITAAAAGKEAHQN